MTGVVNSLPRYISEEKLGCGGGTFFGQNVLTAESKIISDYTRLSRN